MNVAAIEQEVIHILRERALAGSMREIPVAVPLGEAGLHLDSLPLLDFFLAVEKRFGIVLPDSIWAQKDRVSVQYLADHIAHWQEKLPPATAEVAGAPAQEIPAGAAAQAGPAPPATGLYAFLREDIRRARKENVPPGWWNEHVKIWFFPGTLAVVSYRFCHWALNIRAPLLRQLMMILAGIARGVSLLLTGVNISPRAEIGPGLVVHTNYAIYVSPTKIGANCLLQTGVLIAYGVQSIGDNVYFGPGAKIVGRVRIGNNVAIAANSLVLTDVPDNVTAIGVPARIFLPREKPITFERPAET
jgi:serine O-acetyltransferase